MKKHFFAQLDETIATLKTQGVDVIRLDIGSPDLPPHPSVIETLNRSVSRADSHGYQSHLGPLSYREAWAGMYKRVFDVELDPAKEIVTLLGTKEGIFHFSQAYINQGDVVLIPNPYYSTYLRGAEFAGGEAHFMPLLAENDYLPDLDAIPVEIADKAKLMWINYPNNPLSAIAPRSFFEEIVSFAKKHDILICADAAYSQVYYGEDAPPSILQIERAKDVAIEFNSLSKSHNMAGWRIGTAVGNKSALEKLLKLKTNADSGHFGPMLDAASHAMVLESSWIQERNEIYRQRRDVIIQSLRKLEVDIQSPQASLYIWCPIPTSWTSEKFAMAMLKEANVSVAPGTIFGSRGEGFIRISITQPRKRIEKAMQKMSTWWKTGDK
ncbi:MAG: aminotransferase class I/II-fold pyridoxal phosphate-dependent enzyme [Anaerolineae bacterium]|jgi:LL-diaminopimelate aminotransferase|nr:aminotransferase class I/II-fold pyridoxal phosphate-dependent enzyme [Anaerolineae bacterium]MBT3713164.1 aminotransferase class I/II-fold pyridoxal phosphate-dependent enzyme [Anaerolineae bacterium]MBT4309259.1 aminotransferase class I/II-fold pyridoxal phosphate-dependent enzyme [Anaerolineae bacterium]MBT4458510.1 aminotransferase class I/II-fold pyridoxal phosphate-dependent enzyme [Anaerolineae bacterium]MBT4842687.1 aminotransferase class I/II-fold pyridoxal phosphate-dependent enzym